MTDSTDIEKKFAKMEQTTEALKKSVDDKNLHITQLMNKLETFTPGESSHVPTCPLGFDERNKDVEESLANSKFQKEKQSTLVAALSVQQLQDMINKHYRGSIWRNTTNKIGATHVASSIDETKESKGEHSPIITQEHQTNEKLSPSKGDLQTNIDNEQLIFCYIPRERKKKGTTSARGMYSTSSPTEERIESHHIPRFEGENDCPSFPSPVYQFGATQRQYPSYNFSNPAKLRELTDEVTGEKIHGLTKSQMRLRKQGYDVSIPRFGLGFSLSEPLRISSKKKKKITSSHHTSVEKTKESKEEIHSIFPSRMEIKTVLSITRDSSLK
ncbi:hypothetical protein H5410_045429, partial [Solanum commersonii]